MLKKIFAGAFMLLLATLNLTVRAQNDSVPVDSLRKIAIVDSLATSYSQWSEVSMSGKLSSSKLPLSPSVKIYMQKDNLILISVSAPLIGEAARIEIDNQQALIVNKLKNTYTTVETSFIEEICPGGLNAIQNMLLGRAFILGKGQLTSEDASSVELYPVNDGVLMLLPNQDIANAPFVYMFTLDEASLLLDRFIVLTQGERLNMSADYTWGKKDMTIDMGAVVDYKEARASLKLSYPDFKPQPISRIEITSKHKKVDIKGVLKM